MEVRWLGWAGVEIESAGQSVVIDLLGDPLGVLAPVPDIAAKTQTPQVVGPRHGGKVLAGLCTHLHRDHADADALVRALAPGAHVLHPVGFGRDDHENFWLAQAESELQAAGLVRRGGQLGIDQRPPIHHRRTPGGRWHRGSSGLLGSRGRSLDASSIWATRCFTATGSGWPVGSGPLTWSARRSMDRHCASPIASPQVPWQVLSNRSRRH
jgi:L-ascorbate metabolism protein UlaG (beta-lactamase superfamily)